MNSTLNRNFSLTGKTAWIAGGSRGLGLQMARALAGAGAEVAVSSRHEDDARKAADAISKEHSVRTLGGRADVTSEPEVAAFAKRIEAELGHIDILITSAGINIRKPTTDMPLADWQQVLDINLTGPFICSKAVLPRMMQRGWGRVIHVSSMLGLVGLAERPPYTASKGGVILLTKTQALETAASGVTVNALCPGPFATEMNLPLLNDPEKYRQFVARIPMGRWGELHEIEGAVLFLASPSASYVTGTTLTLDGGWTAQ
jgi:NAD(P)-dependent dehydrogenase (short-subunit alcohol dehydrogenase family)